MRTFRWPNSIGLSDSITDIHKGILKHQRYSNCVFELSCCLSLILCAPVANIIFAATLYFTQLFGQSQTTFCALEDDTLGPTLFLVFYTSFRTEILTLMSHKRS